VSPNISGSAVPARSPKRASVLDGGERCPPQSQLEMPGIRSRWPWSAHCSRARKPQSRDQELPRIREAGIGIGVPTFIYVILKERTMSESSPGFSRSLHQFQNAFMLAADSSARIRCAAS